MSFLPWMMNMLGASGMDGTQGLQGGGQGQGAQPQQGQQQWGQEAMKQGPQQLGQVNQAMGYGTTGMPPSLQQALGQNQPQQFTQDPSFGGYYQGNPADGKVLPPLGQQPASNPIQPAQQSFGIQPQVQRQPMGMNSQPPAGGPPAPNQAQSSWSDLFNPIGSMPTGANSQQAPDPNMFLRMSEGYNRGGMLGALGMLLTDYK
jgi:hypothetical protein